ncbi:MAG TPA: hypothetical protein VN676_01505 [Steroidobacteraceae bacterium]|jgi:hypothetical protein|nr:hypothetical protein [Steroidobacteraceae bacterium]
MRYVSWFALWAALLGSAPVLAGLADVAVVDRDTGATLTPHYFHGEYWIAGTPGARYAIEIRNRVAGRLLAVTSVDGVNVVTGETAGWGQNGYVLSSGQHCQIIGWRKSDAEVAAFTFTALPDSYAALTGRPASVGVIGVALFRECGRQSWHYTSASGQGGERSGNRRFLGAEGRQVTGAREWAQTASRARLPAPPASGARGASA